MFNRSLELVDIKSGMLHIPLYPTFNNILLNQMWQSVEM